MAAKIENLTLEILKKIQDEQAASRERDKEILRRLSQIEIGQGALLPHITSAIYRRA